MARSEAFEWDRHNAEHVRQNRVETEEVEQAVLDPARLGQDATTSVGSGVGPCSVQRRKAGSCSSSTRIAGAGSASSPLGTRGIARSVDTESEGSEHAEG